MPVRSLEQLPGRASWTTGIGITNLCRKSSKRLCILHQIVVESTYKLDGNGDQDDDDPERTQLEERQQHPGP